MSTIKAQSHQVGTNVDTTKDITLQADASTGDLVINKGTVETTLTELARFPNSGGGLQYIPAGTGAVSTTVQSKLRQTVSVKDFGAVGDGVTDDTAAFAAAFAASNCVEIPYATTGYKASFTLPSNTQVISDNAKILGSVDCTNAQNSHIAGTLIVIPQTGATYGMKWRKTRYCKFDDLFIGSGAVANVYDGKGLLIEGGPSAGTYYNTVEKLTVLGMKDVGVTLQSDAGDTIFRVGTNHFVSTAVQYCAGGVQLIGASNNVFSELSIEQCTGTVLKIIQVDANGLSNGNQFLSLYTENPSLSTWINTETTAVGTLINLVNTADGTTVPANMRNAAGTVWKSRDSFVVGTSGIASYGSINAWAAAVNIYGATTDTYPRQAISGTAISVGSGTAAADVVVGRQGTGLWGVGTGSLYSLGTWDTGPLRLGSYRLWVDATGKLRIKSGAPASDTDGTVVGTQT